jgi:hypothetical protein
MSQNRSEWVGAQLSSVESGLLRGPNGPPTRKDDMATASYHIENRELAEHC